MMRPLYRLFYREYGIRYSNLLMDPPAFKLSVLPKSALLHTYSTDPEHPELDSSQPYLQGYNKKILLQYLTDYTQPEGQVRKPVFDLKALSLPWRRAHLQTFALEPDAYKTNSNPDTLLVLNYGYLDTVYKYLPSKFMGYHRWLNRWRTICDTINDVAKVSERQQFVFYPIASVLQGRTLLDKYSKEAASLQMVGVLGDHGEGGFFQLDLWQWLSVEHRSKSVLGRIEPRHYSKVNLVFVGSSGNQCLVNLAWLNSWIKGQTNQTEFGQVPQYAPRFMQNLWLKLSMSLNALNLESEDGEIAPQTAASVVLPGADLTDPPTPGDDHSEEDIDPESENVPDLVSATPTPVNEPVQVKSDSTLIIDDTSGSGFQTLSAKLLKDLEADIEALDKISLNNLETKTVRQVKTSAAVEPTAIVPEVLPAVQIDPEEIRARVYEAKTPSQALTKMLEHRAETNLLTAADYRKLNETVAQYQASEDPYGSGQKRLDAMVIKLEDVAMSVEETQLPVSDSVPDPSMKASTLAVFDRKYVRHVMKKDLLNVVDAIQAAGVVVRKHEIDVTHTVLGSYEQHRLELKPIDGMPSSIQFTLPVVEEDGTFQAGGVKYTMRKGRVDQVLRKIAPRIVSLSTYYGKTFVQTNTKVVNDSLKWLCREINQSSFDPNGAITEMNPGNVFDNDFEAPFLYNALAEHYDNFKVRDYTLYFNHRERQNKVNPDLLRLIEKNGRVWCGWSADKAPIVLDKRDHFLQITKNGETDLGDATEFFGFDAVKQPLDFSEVRIFSKYIPVGVVLGYYLGLSGMLSLLGVQHREVPARKNLGLSVDEYALKFKDVSYVFKKDNKAATLILAGFLEFEKALRQYDRVLFDTQDVYFNLLMGKGLGAIYLRELDMMEQAFIDPISKEILASRNEPQTLTGLMIRATEMLTTYTHPASQDHRAMRERGYERFAGFAYKEIMQAVRQFRNKNLAGRSKIDMSPYQVWNSILKDNSVKIVEDINPIQNLKESEVITYAGQGGRDKDTMTKPTRAFHVSDAGVLSESTVDSSAVGTIAYLSPNPQLKNLRGELKDKIELTPSSMLSTSALISPGAIHDPMKRMMFICTQHSHTIASSAYRQPYLRTGYESVIAQRTGKLFATAAEEDGKVTSLHPRGIIVTYASGLQVGIELGRQYGRAEGTVYPHDVITPYQLNDTFKKGDILAYNTKFFEPDFLDPKMIVLKTHQVVNTAFMETNKTHEDSCSISPSVSQQFTTEVTKVKSYIVNFGQSLSHLRKVGEKVEPKDVLMVIEDEITASHSQFGEEALDTLKRLAHMAPRASVLGVVERYEVFYHGDKQDMTPSLKALADKSDQFLASTAKAAGKPVVTGRVRDDYRVKGTPLEMDHAEIRVYLTVKAVSGVGDKAVFGHQMKSTISEVHPGSMRTENGDSVDATFSYRSVAARGVLSPSLLGTTITLLDALSKKAAAIYFGDAK